MAWFKSGPMYLDKIVAHKQGDPDFLQGRQQDWKGRLDLNRLEPRRSLVNSLRSSPAGQPSIIAEMKRASPSKGSFDYQGTVTEQVRAYERGGAKAVSVLTNQPFFSGHERDLQEARQAISLPVLRKDFLLEPWEVAQSKVWGADAILLIAAILSDQLVTEMIEQARQLDLEVLLEIHDREELERTLALPVAPHAVGINNRNLRTFELSLDTTAELAPLLPKEICRVSESGFATRDDLLRFEGIVDAFLIGETLMRSPQPERTLTGWIKG
jgi:indole-3-glycerol phosphate synthase